MDNQRPRNKFWFVFFALFFFWYLLLYGFDRSSLPGLSSVSRHQPQDPIQSKPSISIPKEEDDAIVTKRRARKPCTGRYIYVHDLPTRFNQDYIKQCKVLDKWHDMCPYFANNGLGESLGNPQRLFQHSGWYVTNQFSLDVIFHNRMKQYECLTTDSSKAAAVYVPFYPGFDVSRFLWDPYSTSVKDADIVDLFKLLRAKPEWDVMGGKDHFMVAGRITWDLRRVDDKDSVWGNKLMVMPESQNMTMMTIESSPWDKNDFAIPYPTYFHPSSDGQVHEWQGRMRRQKRSYLFSFAGAPRPNMEGSIRGEIMAQCAASRRKCGMVDCRDDKHTCFNPANVMRMFQSSVFCLQPPGDSFTRRSTFDSIVAGCIPVFFSPGSAYVQYLWHLPKDYGSYSVLIPEAEVKGKKVSIESVLSRIPASKVAAMRENVIKLIPNVIYADPRSRLEKLDDAFDLAIRGVVERVESLRREVKEGRNSSFEFDSEFSWKYYTFGTTGPHEWDNYFKRYG
ncbi:xyloglucan galactosyltransferase katamari1 homolog [Phtheirospermum japonicum]|uniref:Xyloglucan galactosyltransferase katamari1 homolog n=1 Tax=Phtheirospermum japonicum TaxID=374723 RepID=A0A830BD97_9LAMI|nr:xyloglucan galactosyltransferase katamari1 homolog [Phtheirospermum japonicum]